MTDEHEERDPTEAEDSTRAEESAPAEPEDSDPADREQESNPGEIQSYERAREVREEPDAPEGEPAGAGGPAEERGDRLPPAQAGDESARSEPIAEASSSVTPVEGRTAGGFDEVTPDEPLTEPDQPLAEAETAGAIPGVSDSVDETHQREGMVTLEAAVEAEGAAPGGRYEELMDKRKRIGLTDGEAAELGRLVAEAEGAAYHGSQPGNVGAPQDKA